MKGGITFLKNYVSFFITRKNPKTSQSPNRAIGDDCAADIGAYLRGIKRELWVAPIPGLPCLTGL